MCRLPAFLVAASLAVTSMTAEDTKRMGDDPYPLSDRDRVERVISPGESHQYSISLRAGQFVHILFDRRGVGLEATLLDPGGRTMLTIDARRSRYGPEPISFLAAESSDYRLTICSPGSKDLPLTCFPFLSFGWRPPWTGCVSRPRARFGPRWLSRQQGRRRPLQKLRLTPIGVQ